MPGGTNKFIVHIEIESCEHAMQMFALFSLDADQYEAFKIFKAVDMFSAYS